MKRKPLIVAMLIAVFSVWLMPEASAQRRHYQPRYGHYHGRGYHPRPYYRSRVYVAPPPRVVVVPRYGYRRGYYRPRGYYRRPYYHAVPRHYHGRGRGHYHRGRGWR